MDIKAQLETDLKTALLAGDKDTATTLRGLKGAILNVEIAQNARETGLSNDAVIDILAKEAKKRQESADLYIQGNDQTRADKELAEKAIIEKYLPAQLSDEELTSMVEAAIAETGASGPQAMGQVIGKVKAQAGGQADGGRIAKLVKEKLSA